MSVHKYAGLPDIDTAPDVYETEDVFPTAHENKVESSDEESAPAKGHGRGKHEGPSKDELDTGSLIEPDEATKKFRKAEKRQRRSRVQYTYPPSPDSSGRTSPVLSTPALPLSMRLKRLQAELASLETELADPSNPLLHKEREEGHVDPGELIKAMVDVKGRLEKIAKVKEGRGKLVSIVLDEAKEASANDPEVHIHDMDVNGSGKGKHDGEDGKPKSEVKEMAEIDQRVGELERIVGSSTITVDETSPLPPPLLPLLTRLNNQLTLLTQPRHIDSTSRRLKLLLADLDRVSTANAKHDHQGSSAQRRGTSHAGGSSAVSSPHPNASSQSGAAGGSGPSTTVSEQLIPILTRLAPLLPHIPHILSRLRTLSNLHTSAAAFQSTLEGLEEEQRKSRAALEELQKAVEGVERSWKENENVVKGNVKVLEDRVEDVQRKIDELALLHARE
ncbi:hypothetical protein K474DRAFT_1655955 [Panus rudis PR-1116 ss-1]|nr:hypothetical protein K474DRAFT_1655955 [Panus rudis PR-1116 ss-1]